MHAILHDLTGRYGLNAAQTRALWDAGGLHRRPERLGHGLVRALAVLAALLLGAGLVFWVAAHWTGISPTAKYRLLQGAVALPALAALALPRWRAAWLLLAVLALGGLLALVGQTWQGGADAWPLFAAWAALSLGWVLAARRDALWALWLAIAGAALSLFMHQGHGLLDWLDDGAAAGWPLAVVLALWLALFLWPLALPRLGLLAPAARPRWAWRVAAFGALLLWCAVGEAGLLALPHAARAWPYAACLLLVGLAVWLGCRLYVRGSGDMAVLAMAVLALDALLMSALAHAVLRSLDWLGEVGFLLLCAAGFACLAASLRWLHGLQRRVQAAADSGVDVGVDAGIDAVRPALPAGCVSAGGACAAPVAPVAPADGHAAASARPLRLRGRRASALALVQAAQEQGVLPPHAVRDWRALQAAGHATGASWMLAVLGFFGMFWVVSAALAFLAMLLPDVFFSSWGAGLGAAVFAGAGAAGLRGARIGLVRALLCFCAVLLGLGLLAVLLFGFGGEVHWHLKWLCLLAATAALALAVRVGWAQAVLGALAAWLALWLGFAPDALPDALDARWHTPLPPVANATALALLWALATVRESHGAADSGWPGRWRRALAATHMARQGLAVGLLLALAAAAAQPFWMGQLLGAGAAGSADAAHAGTAHLLGLGGRAALGVAWQMALVAGALAWLARHWQIGAGAQHGRAPAETAALCALLACAMLLACLALPHAGVLALLGVVALGTGRRVLGALVLLAWLAGLCGFYYALQWPLAEKAALLAGMGALLALGLLALHARRRRGIGAQAAAGRPRRRPTAAFAALVLGALVLSLGWVQAHVAQRQRVAQGGRLVHVALAPADPRSLMQGDYMALRYALPDGVRTALKDVPAHRRPVAVAQVDARGVATVLALEGAAGRLASLPADRVRLPLRHTARGWVVASDAYFFPEGQGRPFAAARFARLRVTPDGQAVLVGLADDNLQPIKAEGRASIRRDQ